MLALIMSFLLFQASGPSETPVTLPATKTIEWHSETLGGKRLLQVATPLLPVSEDAELPILLTMDGDAMFGLTSDTARLMAWEQSAPPMVVVGIAYGDLTSWIRQRQIDYHPRKGDQPGVEVFVRALLAEAVPLIRHHVPQAQGDIYLYGHSSGGIVALEALRQTGVKGVIASSPSLDAEEVWSTQLAETIGTPADDIRIFISSGGGEQRVIAALDAFLETATDVKSHPNLILRYYGELPHMQVIPGALADGLNAVVRPQPQEPGGQ